MSTSAFLKLFLAEVAIVGVGVAIISATYIWILPRFFHDQKTYSVLIGGLLVIALGSGVIAFRATSPEGRIPAWLFVAVVSGVATVSAFLVSLFIILNTRGS